MSAELRSWPRPHFTPGGGSPLLFFVVFGEFDLTKTLSRSKYRSNGPGDWLEVTHLARDKQADALASYQTGPLWDQVTRDAPITAAASLKALQGAVVRGGPVDPPTLDYFRDGIGVVTWLLDCGGVSVHDPQRLWLWGPDEWRSDVFAPHEPRPQEHTVILVSEDGDHTQWLHTRGMRQYGRPDLSVHGVGPSHLDAVTQLLEHFIAMQAFGGVVGNGQQVRMRGLPPGGVCRHGGSVDDPEFNNVHIEITWADGALRT
jgi:hypothetical protein